MSKRIVTVNQCIPLDRGVVRGEVSLEDEVEPFRLFFFFFFVGGGGTVGGACMSVSLKHWDLNS